MYTVKTWFSAKHIYYDKLDQRIEVLRESKKEMYCCKVTIKGDSGVLLYCRFKGNANPQRNEEPKSEEKTTLGPCLRTFHVQSKVVTT